MRRSPKVSKGGKTERRWLVIPGGHHNYEDRTLCVKHRLAEDEALPALFHFQLCEFFYSASSLSGDDAGHQKLYKSGEDYRISFDADVGVPAHIYEV